jgi:4-hydroxybenzoate polyprenyltransferase
VLKLPAIAIRPAHWWFSKLPIPAMLLILLSAGDAAPVQVAVALAALLAIVASVGNFGYALNELFDIEEDRIGGRSNVAAAQGWEFVALVAAASMMLATGLSYAVVDPAGAILTLSALSLPVLYSAPPFHFKRRRWPGIICDAGAAHLFPTLLALLFADKIAPGSVTRPLAVLAIVWATMHGLRGILTHQLMDEDRDRATGLRTVVHQYGRHWVERFILWFSVPVEIAAFALLALESNLGFVFYAFCVLYAVYEAGKLKRQWKIKLFRQSEQPYLPFLNNAFYETWGPVAVASDAATRDVSLVFLVPVIIILFWPRMWSEWKMIVTLVRDTGKDLLHRQSS